MGRIQLKIPPHLAALLNSPKYDWVVIEHEIGEEANIGEVLTDLASSNPNFRKVIFDPVLGHFCDQINVVINDKLLTYEESTRARLKDGDVIMFLPIYTGG